MSDGPPGDPLPPYTAPPPNAPWQPPPLSRAPTPPASQPTTQRRGMSTKKKVLIGGGVVTAGLVVLVAIISFVVLRNLSAAADNVPASALIGECYGNDGSKQSVSCLGRHHFEVYGASVYPDDMSYPGTYQRSAGNTVCDEDFEAYTGDSYWTSDYDYQVIFPPESNWAAGDRVALCVLHQAELRVIEGRVGNPGFVGAD